MKAKYYAVVFLVSLVVAIAVNLSFDLVKKHKAKAKAEASWVPAEMVRGENADWNYEVIEEIQEAFAEQKMEYDEKYDMQVERCKTQYYAIGFKDSVTGIVNYFDTVSVKYSSCGD
ncbi:MAG: hypothetical protein LBL47_04985 [Lactobacillus sp.]|jgi:hypothetical protein|nr:hypothetical protein [Lactobacillus sp.]